MVKLKGVIWVLLLDIQILFFFLKKCVLRLTSIKVRVSSFKTFFFKETKIEIDQIFGQIPFQHLSTLKADSNFSNLLVEMLATF